MSSDDDGVAGFTAPDASYASVPASRPRRADRHNSRNVGRGFAIGASVVAAVLSVTLFLVAGYAWATYRNFTANVPVGTALPKVTKTQKDIDGSAQNILLVGNDSRAGATAAELKALSTGSDGGSSNTDTIMLLHVPADGAKATIISFPRDSYVDIPGYGMDKINAAYPDGYNTAKEKGGTEEAAEGAGIITLSATIAELTGLHIDHYVQIDLLGFYRISNAIGGVRVCLLHAAKEPKSGINLPAGVSTIKGTQALAFVRQRYDFPDGLGDIDRIKRQQYFLSAVFKKVTGSTSALLKFNKLLSAVSSSLLIDPDLDLITLAGQLQDLSAGNVTFSTIPWDGFATENNESVVAVDPEEVKAAVDQIIGLTDAVDLSRVKAAAAAGVTVNVQNGSGKAEAATINAAALHKQGFVTTAAPSKVTFNVTTIEYPQGKQAEAKAVLLAVPGARTVELNSLKNVTLILGKGGVQVASLTPKASTSPSTAPSGSTSTGPRASVSTTTTPSASASTPKTTTANQSAGCIN
jgi:LCP family protein required for cell wall assembly